MQLLIPPAAKCKTLFDIPLATILKLVLTGFKIFNALIKYLDNKKMLDAGAKAQIARDTAEIQKTIGFVAELKKTTGGMTDEQLDNILGGGK